MNVLTSFRVKRELKERLLNHFPSVHFIYRENMDNAKAELHDADILITYGEDLDKSLIASAKRLKWIMVLSAGMEQMPFDAIEKRGILVTNAKGIHAIPMAEYTLAMMLQVARQTKTLIQLEQEEKWLRSVKMMELASKTVAIIGAGAIGSEIGRLAKAFRMKTIGVNTDGRAVEHIDHAYPVWQLEEAVKGVDFVVSVLPSTKKTKNLFTEDCFKVMKNDVVFINIGRGDVVDEQLLIRMLKEGEVRHAVLDVHVQEPLPKGHPYWEMEQVTVTPHLSGISDMYQPRGFEIFEHNLEVFLQGFGEYRNKVDLSKGY
ncbi:D-2-hydroxyacid dehydrogenase [Bacillus solimangrovi]|uniref:3-phosphoglycerate dehydrogenase n=1 Tax=Bacillus solimangrovi TaxID=1305675 RepID=A0A1E5LBD9_9BACI|nr:D-2-hydroxyacid dehydrogenase [Bacillus solimangrovi]OEH91410.1 3-phosphoglycerate dehydrogenase [Bacillus solimangrovi]